MRWEAWSLSARLEPRENRGGCHMSPAARGLGSLGQPSSIRRGQVLALGLVTGLLLKTRAIRPPLQHVLTRLSGVPGGGGGGACWARNKFILSDERTPRNHKND